MHHVHRKRLDTPRFEEVPRDNDRQDKFPKICSLLLQQYLPMSSRFALNNDLNTILLKLLASKINSQ